MAQKIIAKDFYVYSFFLASIAPATSGQPVTVTIQNDSQFLWQKTSYFCTMTPGGAFGPGDTEAGRILPEISIQIVDTSSGRQQFNREVELGSIAGDGRFPFILPEPRLFVPKTTITMTISNYSAASTYENLYINMIGTKLFWGDAN